MRLASQSLANQFAFFLSLLLGTSGWLAAEPVKSAFFAETTVGYGIARMYESLMEGAMIQVRAVRTRAAAAEWLGVPLDVLLPDAD